MADFNKRIASDNSHLEGLTSGKFAHVISTATGGKIKSKPGKLLRVILNTNGSTLTLKNGSEVIAVIASDAPEATYEYGVYCNDSIVAEAGGAIDATVVFQ